MKRFRPIHGLLVVVVLMLATFAAERLLGGDRATATRVSPDRDGRVVIDASDIEPSDVRFFRFLNSGNQEVRFLVGRDPAGEIVVAFDASENDFKRKRGFRHEGDWLVNNKCDTATKLAEVPIGRGGCAPVPVHHRVEGSNVVLTENDLLAGWRYFR
ncbi:MAG: Fe-S-containing protein [Thermoanaerobaculia bacterium]